MSQLKKFMRNMITSQVLKISTYIQLHYKRDDPLLYPLLIFVEGTFITLWDINIYDVSQSYLCSRGYYCGFSAQINRN